MRVLSKMNSTLVYNIILVIIGLTIPLAGSLADVRFGRYKVICCSLWVMWISSIIIAATSVVAEFTNIPHKEIAVEFLTVPLALGWAGLQANIIQFGIDQLIDASAEEYKSFAAWFVWMGMVGQIVQNYILQCAEYMLLAPFMICLYLTIAVVLNIILNNILIKEPTTHNPFKLVYKVITYAMKHKYPTQRSAFTYCEDDIPPRIDFGKMKYGGPFTTEQVEDVKTLFRIVLVIVIGSALYSIVDTSTIYQIFRSDTNHQSLGECSGKFFITRIYFVCGIILIPLHELLIYPVSHRLITNIRSFHKFATGAILCWIELIVIIAIITYSRQNYIQRNRNETIACLFYETPTVLGDYIDYRWTILPEFIRATANIMIFIGCLEHLCAQVPYSMKGLVVGIVYTFISILLVKY